MLIGVVDVNIMFPEILRLLEVIVPLPNVEVTVELPTVNDVSLPTLVILFCDAVVNVPVKLAAPTVP